MQTGNRLLPFKNDDDKLELLLLLVVNVLYLFLCVLTFYFDSLTSHINFLFYIMGQKMLHTYGSWLM